MHVLGKRKMSHCAEIVPSIELRRDLLEMSLSSNPAVAADENLASSWLLTSFPALHSKDAHMFSLQQVQVASLQTIYPTKQTSIVSINYLMTEPMASALFLPSANTKFCAVTHCSEHDSTLPLLYNKSYVLVPLF